MTLTLEQERRAEERRRRELEKQRLRDLENHAANWEKSNQIRSFISAVEEKVTEMGTAPEVSERLKKWALWAQNHANSLDPVSGDKVLSVIAHEADVNLTTER